MRSSVPVAAGLALFVAFVYAGVRDHAYLNHDDRTVVIENPLLDPALTWPELISRSFREPIAGNWIPLTWIALRVEQQLFGPGAPALLVSQAALHALAAVLLFFALRAATGALGPSAFAAGVFAAHPMRVESVAWASEFKDPLSGLCFTALLWAWSRYSRRPSAGRYALAAALLTAGLLAKPTLVTAPLVLLLFDWWPLGRLRSAALRRLALVDKLPLAALAAAVAWITYRSQQGAAAMSFGSSLPLLSRISNACESALAYLAQSLWPTGIAAFHPHPASRISIASGLGAALVLVFATAISLATRASRPYLAVGWLWYLSMLAPVSGIVQIGLQARAERYVYLPQIGLSLIVAWCVRELAGSGRRARAIAAGAGVIAIGVLAILAQREVGYWRDTRTLFERARAVTGDNFYAEQVLAGLDLEAGDAAAAERGYRRALALEPGYAPAMLGLGTALAVLDRHDEAVAALRDGLTIAPHAGGEAQLAALLADRGDLAEALDHFARAEELGNRALETQLAFASALRRAGRGSEARARLEALLTRDAAARAARLELAWLHATCAEPELRAPAAALSLLAPLLGSGAPRGARLLDVHAAALASSGELARAVEVAREAESLASASAAPERQKAAIRERRDRYEAGSAIADRCVASQSADGATRRQEQR